MKYTHFFSPWVDSLFNLDYSEPFGTNLDQSWLFRTISRPFLANLGYFLTCFWGQIPIFSWVTPAFDIDFGLCWIIRDYFGPIWTNCYHFWTISGQFGSPSVLYWGNHKLTKNAPKIIPNWFRWFRWFKIVQIQ